MKGKKNIAGYSSRSQSATDARIASRSDTADYTTTAFGKARGKI